MAVFHVQVFQRGAAFGEEGDTDAAFMETSRILREVSDRIRSGYTEGTIDDFNGNPACTFRTEVDG